MSDNVQIALIIAVALVLIAGIVVFVLKDKLRSGKIAVRKDGIKGGVETHGPSVNRISGVKIKGNENNLTATNGGQIDKADIEGNKNRLKS